MSFIRIVEKNTTSIEMLASKIYDGILVKNYKDGKGAKKTAKRIMELFEGNAAMNPIVFEHVDKMLEAEFISNHVGDDFQEFASAVIERIPQWNARKKSKEESEDEPETKKKKSRLSFIDIRKKPDAPIIDKKAKVFTNTFAYKRQNFMAELKTAKDMAMIKTKLAFGRV